MGRCGRFAAPEGFRSSNPQDSVSLNPLGKSDAALDGRAQGWFRSVHYRPEEVHALLDH